MSLSLRSTNSFQKLALGQETVVEGVGVGTQAVKLWVLLLDKPEHEVILNKNSCIVISAYGNIFVVKQLV